MAPPIKGWPRLLDRGRLCLHSNATFTCVACNTPFAYTNRSRAYTHARKCQGENRQEVPRELALADADENAIMQNLSPTQQEQRMRERLQHAKDVDRAGYGHAGSPQEVHQQTAPATGWSGPQRTGSAQTSVGTRSNHEMDWSPARQDDVDMEAHTPRQ